MARDLRHGPATRDARKRAAARAALDLVPPGAVVGVGTGSTANHFIDALAERRGRIDGAVASSGATAARLEEHGIRVLDLNAVGELSIYVDGADEATPHRQLIKGGGGALTREKIAAAAARRFVCIVDDSKLVDTLGAFPLPVEIIPMARSHVARQIVKMGGRPIVRDAFVTDNGNIILDIHDLEITQPIRVERALNQLTGVVTNGLFAERPADLLLVGTAGGVDRLE